jgi:hypothetical protein
MTDENAFTRATRESERGLVALAGTGAAPFIYTLF